MFNKRLLLNITLDKNKLKTGKKDSCTIECIPTINLLTETERRELELSLRKVCDLLRLSYIRYMDNYTG